MGRGPAVVGVVGGARTGLPFTTYAVDGAQVTDVVGEHIPAFSRRAASPAARYDLGCLYIGVNDVRALDWDAAGV